MKAFWLAVLMLLAWQGLSQERESDSIHLLSEVVISAGRIEKFSAGLQVKTLEKHTFQSQPGILLSDYLATQGTNFIKTYGAGGLASISMRGTAAQHTSVYWNGFSINPPNIDMADLSMLPLFLFNRIDLVSGGSSTLFGNGSIGGSIHLNSQNGYRKNQLQVALSLGQYGNRLLGIKSDYRVGKLFLSSTAWLNRANNDFSYVNTTKFGSPKERLSNADATYAGILQELNLPLGSNQHMKAGFWLQQREAGIPPSMTMHQSFARQHDRMFRGYLQWVQERNRIVYSAKTGYTHDYLKYTDSLIALRSELRVGVWNSEIEVSASLFKNTNLSAGVNYQLFNANIDAYQGRVNPQQISFFSLLNHEFPELEWVISLGARKEVHSDFKNIPPAFSLGWNGKIARPLSGRLNISTNYRTPTLNDRFWQPGGNPDLKAETSLNLDAGFDWAIKRNNTKSNLSATVYNNRIENWITWLPTASGYWKPENITSVFIYGLEAKINGNYQTQKLHHRYDLGYTLAKSLYGAGSFEESKDLHQLIYTPVHTAFAFYGVDYGSWSVQYTHRITGSRYTDRANTYSLPAFHTADINLSRSLNLRRSSLIINASVKNITNHRYQVIEFRPMPGRTFNMSIIFQLSSAINSSPKTKML